MTFLFENDYAFVNEAKELWLKENSFFGSRKIADLDEQEIEDAMAVYEQAFHHLEENVRSLMEELHELDEKSAVDRKIAEMMEQIQSIQAVGDFESLLNSLSTFTHVEHTEEPVAEPVVPEPELPMSEGLTFYAKLLARAEELVSLHDVAQAEHDLSNLRFHWKESPEIGDGEGERFKAISKRFDEIGDELRAKRTEHFDEMSKRRADNLAKKKELLERLSAIVEKKKWTAVGEVKSIENRLEDIKSIPSEWVERLDAQHKALIAKFEEGRVGFLVKQKEREEENLALKQLLLDKFRQLVDSLTKEMETWDQPDAEFNSLLSQWKKVGRVVKEKEQDIWDEFRKHSAAFEDAKIQLNPKYKEKLLKNEKRKATLCDQAEALLLQEDLAVAAREINRLHKEWKQVGPVMKDKSEELWKRFKTASDSFNARKGENLDLIKELENANLAKKEALIEKATALKEAGEVSSSSRDMEQLLEEWKQIGPVPRRKSQKIWEQFKGIMDEFYTKKRDHFKEQRQGQKNNLTEKREIIEKIKALATAEDPQAAINEIKALQDQYNKVGFVPIKYKNKLWKQYHDACDAVYQRSREARKASAPASGGGYRENRNRNESYSSGGTSESQKLKKEVDKLKELVMHYSDTMTYIKPNKQGIKLREEIQAKIDDAKRQMVEKSAQLDALNTAEKVESGS